MMEGAPIDIGEASRDITIYDINVMAPDMNLDYFITLNRCHRVDIHNLKATYDNVQTWLNVRGRESPYNTLIEDNLSNIELTALTKYAQGLNAVSLDAANQNLSFNNIKFWGTCSTYNGATAIGVYVTGAWANVSMNSIYTEGGINTNGGTLSNVVLSNSLTAPYMSQNARDIVLLNHAEIGSDAMPSMSFTNNQTITSTTANNSVLTFSTPDRSAQVYMQGDRYRVKFSGTVTGTNDAKTIQLVESNSGTTIHAWSYAAGETGAFQYEADIIMYHLTGNYLFRPHGWYNDKGTIAAENGPIYYHANDVGSDLDLQAWVDNASDSISIYYAEIEFLYKGEAYGKVIR